MNRNDDRNVYGNGDQHENNMVQESTCNPVYPVEENMQSIRNEETKRRETSREEKDAVQTETMLWSQALLCCYSIRGRVYLRLCKCVNAPAWVPSALLTYGLYVTNSPRFACTRGSQRGWGKAEHSLCETKGMTRSRRYGNKLLIISRTEDVQIHSLYTAHPTDILLKARLRPMMCIA